MLLALDEKFEFDNKKARLVNKGGVADVAVDSVFLISEEIYHKRPAWVLIFGVLCLSLIYLTRFLWLVGIALGLEFGILE